MMSATASSEAVSVSMRKVRGTNAKDSKEASAYAWQSALHIIPNKRENTYFTARQAACVKFQAENRFSVHMPRVTVALGARS
jgi:hypothetical protein